jgi:hypothetical protein
VGVSQTHEAYRATLTLPLSLGKGEATLARRAKSTTDNSLTPPEARIDGELDLTEAPLSQ